MLQFVKGRKMENNEPIRDQEIEIDLVALFHELVKHWKALVASMVLLAAVFGLYSKITFVPEYEASAEMYVLTKSTSITSLADIQVGSSLTNDYEYVITGRTVLSQVIDNLDKMCIRDRYFKVVDGDDWLDKSLLPQFVQLLKHTHSDVISNDFNLVDDRTKKVTKRRKAVSNSYHYNREWGFAEAVMDPLITIHSMTIRTDVLQKNDIRVDEHCFYEDQEYILYPIPVSYTHLDAYKRQV